MVSKNFSLLHGNQGNKILDLSKIVFEEKYLLMSVACIEISVFFLFFFIKEMTVMSFKDTSPIPQRFCQKYSPPVRLSGKCEKF